MVGAGLAGPLMASYLSKHGYSVEIHEKRKDMRLFDQSAGRSINLALSRRGMDALRDIGVLDTWWMNSDKYNDLKDQGALK